MKTENRDALFLLSKKEKRGIFFLLILLMLLYQIPDIIYKYFPPSASLRIQLLNDTSFTEHFDTNNPSNSFQRITDSFTSENSDNSGLFTFNPNTIDEESWLRLGVNAKTVKTIKNYLSKGGSFKRAEDIKKIWGMPEGLANQLIPFVSINDSKSQDDNKRQPPHWVQKKQIELNASDVEQLESLPGIGPTFSKRIISYRNLLGGFYTLQQLKEVWGISDSLFNGVLKFLIVDPGKSKKINLNTATITEFQKHPYFKYRIARALIDFRNQHGLYKRLEDIQKIILIDEQTYKKIIHYLVVE